MRATRTSIDRAAGCSARTTHEPSGAVRVRPEDGERIAAHAVDDRRQRRVERRLRGVVHFTTVAVLTKSSFGNCASRNLLPSDEICACAFWGALPYSAFSMSTTSMPSTT